MLDKEEVTILTEFSLCGYSFKTGEEYLVWADLDDKSGKLVTGICDRTKKLADSAPDVVELGAGRQFAN
jgi:hypothetical protein